MKKFIIYLSGFLLILFSSFSNPVFIHSEAVSTNIESIIESGPTNERVFNPSLGVYINRILDVALVIAALICLLLLIVGGIEWVSSGGNKENLEKAKKTITNAVTGLAITAAVWAIWLLVLTFLGINKMPQLQIEGSGGNTSNSTPSPTLRPCQPGEPPAAGCQR